MQVETNLLADFLQDSDFDVEIYPFKIVNDNGVRGSSTQYDERENISSQVRGENGECLCSLEKAKERCCSIHNILTLDFYYLMLHYTAVHMYYVYKTIYAT